MAFRTNKMPVLQTKSASGSVASFNTALAMPLVSCNIAVNAWQEGSGDPSPSNVRAIHGFDKVRIGMVNWNCLYDFTENSARWKSNGTVTRTWNNGVLTISNGNTNSAYAYQEFQETVGHKMLYYCVGESIKDESATLYSALSIYAGTGTTNITKYFTNEKATYSGIYEAISTATNRLQFRPNDTRNSMNVYELILVDLTQAFGSRIADYLYNLENNQEGAGVAVFRQLFYKDYYDYNVGGTWVSVASVNGNSYPDYAQIQLGQEVYGAEVDTDGVAHCTHRKAVFDGSSDENWFNYAAGNGYYITLADMDILNNGDVICDWLDKYSGISNLGIRLGFNNNVVYAYQVNTISGVSDLTSWADYLSNNPLEVVYPLKTPFDIQLTPQQIETLIGNNTIFADTGDVDLTYKDLDIAKRGNFREVFKLPS